MLLHTNNTLKQPVISLDAKLKENDKKLYQEMKNEWKSDKGDPNHEFPATVGAKSGKSGSGIQTPNKSELE